MRQGWSKDPYAIVKATADDFGVIMGIWLTTDQLRELTDKVRPSAQARALDFMGIFYRKRPDGSLAVLSAHVEAPGMARPPREPSLRLPA